jgi:hypothetical protein
VIRSVSRIEQIGPVRGRAGRTRGVSYGTRRVDRPDDLWRLLRRDFSTRQWAFRGHQQADWHPRSSLERYCDAFRFGKRERAIVESYLIDDFCRTAQPLGVDSAVLADLEALVALMQHHGTPTRFLDWTYSLFVAAYVALEDATGSSAVWALDTEWLNKEAKRVASSAAFLLQRYDDTRDGDSFVRAFMPQLLSDGGRPSLFVYAVNPRILNRRLTIQQGLFTAVGDVRKSFFENLVGYRDARRHLLKISIPRDVGREILSLLHRMGISRDSLYPGLDGFAWSLRTKAHALRYARREVRPWVLASAPANNQMQRGAPGKRPRRR